MSDGIPPQLLHLLELGRYAEARTAAAVAVAADPHDIGALTALADALSGLGDHAAALEAVDRALAASPEADGLHTFRSACLTELHRPGEAERAAREAVRLAPLVPTNLARLALALSESGDHEALGTAQRAVSLAPDDPDLRFTLALVARACGKPQLARENYERVLAAVPDHSAAANNLVNLDADRALAHRARRYGEALAIDPQDEVARHNLDLMVLKAALAVGLGAALGLVALGVSGRAWVGAAALVAGAVALLVNALLAGRRVRRFAASRLRGHLGPARLLRVVVACAGLVVLVLLAATLVPGAATDAGGLLTAGGVVSGLLALWSLQGTGD